MTRIRVHQSRITSFLTNETIAEKFRKRASYIERRQFRNRTSSPDRKLIDLQFALSKLSEYQKGYIAGMIDGEGNISILINTKARPIRRAYVLRLSNTDLQMMQTLRRWLANAGSFRCENRENYPNTRPIYRLQFNGRFAHAILDAVMPYLIIKKRKASLFLQLRKSRQETVSQGMAEKNRRNLLDGKPHYSSDEIEMLREIRGGRNSL